MIKRKWKLGEKHSSGYLLAFNPVNLLAYLEQMVDLKALRFLNKSFIFHRSLGMFCDLYMYKRVRIKKNGNLVSDGCHSAVLYVL